ncbi:hypothetical protein AVEN_46686-1 [Araneus ventricosus]|uniref:Uncharacterized protein n=1 Tax=Araneus ventricosus TaxID=182803 RepID=A0A4Y2R1Q5_ARAVE|nr:hypothetical protein AVEN_46686-1 [Araneus ventricosus]
MDQVQAIPDAPEDKQYQLDVDSYREFDQIRWNKTLFRSYLKITDYLRFGVEAVVASGKCVCLYRGLQGRKPDNGSCQKCIGHVAPKSY